VLFLYFKNLFFLSLIFFKITTPFQVVLDLGIQLFASGIAAKAEVKKRTEGYKHEIIQGLNEITNIIDREAIKIKNLQGISLIKNELIRRIQLNKNKTDLITSPLIDVIYTSYKNYLQIIKQLIEKHKLLGEKTKDSNIQIFLHIAIYSLQVTFNEYINFLKQYNYKLQDINQKIQTNNEFIGIYANNNENKKFIDKEIDITTFFINVYELISNNDKEIDGLIKTRSLLSSNNFTSFNLITKNIIDLIDNLENKESKKDISSQSEKFYDYENYLEKFKIELFSAFDQFDVSLGESQSFLYKMISLLDINSNKIKRIIELINNVLGDKNYSIKNFFKELYENFSKLKKEIKINQSQYLNIIKTRDEDFLKLFSELKNYLAFINNNINTILFDNIYEVLRKIRKNMYEYYNLFAIKRETLDNDLMQIGHINSYILDLYNKIEILNSKIKKNITEKKKNSKNIKSDLVNKNTNDTKQNDIFESVYAKRKKDQAQIQIVNTNSNNNNSKKKEHSSKKRRHRK
jgi:hypothetical protein